MDKYFCHGPLAPDARWSAVAHPAAVPPVSPARGSLRRGRPTVPPAPTAGRAGAGAPGLAAPGDRGASAGPDARG